MANAVNIDILTSIDQSLKALVDLQKAAEKKKARAVSKDVLEGGHDRDSLTQWWGCAIANVIVGRCIAPGWSRLTRFARL